VPAAGNGRRAPAVAADLTDAGPRPATAAAEPRAAAGNADRTAAGDAKLRAAAADAELRAAATDAELRSQHADARNQSAARRAAGAGDGQPCRPPCCPLYHEAIELIGRRWTGAIVSVLIHHSTLRFGEIGQLVPELSDRLLSERMKELEARGVVVRTVRPGRPVRVEYELTHMGRELEPVVRELEDWAQRWLG